VATAVMSAAPRPRAVGESGRGMLEEQTWVDSFPLIGQIYTLYFTGDGARRPTTTLTSTPATVPPSPPTAPASRSPRWRSGPWRSIYAPNFDPLTNQGTTIPHIDPRLNTPETA
jgi:hypothetical protein